MNKILLLILLLIALIVSVIISISIGSVSIPFSEILSVFSSNNETYKRVILDIRLPRVLNAISIGAALSCSGIILQSLLKNNLAEPGLLGISAGAGLGAIIVFMLPFSLTYFLLTPVSFVFALLATMLIFLISKGFSFKYTNFIYSNKIILAGIAINALLSSINGFLMILSGESLSQIIFWLNGGLSGRGWNEFYYTIGFILIGLISAILLSKDLNILSLGNEISLSLGLNLKFIQKICIVVASVLAASAVSIAGIISFVGLIVPNIAKLVIGEDYRYSVPCSILLGAIFLVISDTLARTLISPAEIPVGIVTSFIGAPVFIWLILRRERSQI